jgi:hypothetical protein
MAMIRESLVDSALNRLSAHFGPRLVVHPPIDADRLAEFEHVVGPLPREFAIFLLTCDGLRIHGEARADELHLWSTSEILSSVVGPIGPGVRPGFVPVCGDPTGERDWLILGHGPTAGALLRWDPWVPGAELIASNFGTYLLGWVEYLVSSRAADGGVRSPSGQRRAFDSEFCALHDAQLHSLQTDPHVVEWLHNVDQAVACGDDYE